MDGLFFDWRTWSCMGTRPKILDTFGDRPVHRPLKKLSGLEVVDAKLSAAQDKLSEHFNPTPPSSPKMTGKQLTLGWLPTQAPPSPKPKAIKAVPLKYHTQQMWAAALLVLAVLALGYTRGLNRASEYGGTYGGTDVPHSTLLVTEDGQATQLATTLLLVAILLAPVVLTRIGSRVALVLTAAMPTAFVWLLPVAAKFEFANSITMLNSHDEADIVGVITTPQATGWMVALFSLPLVALLRIAEVGGRGPQYSSRLRTTGVTTVVLFYVWLVFGAWMRAPVTLTIEPTTTQQKPRALPPPRITGAPASAGALQLPSAWRDRGGEHRVFAHRWPAHPTWRRVLAVAALCDVHVPLPVPPAPLGHLHPSPPISLHLQRCAPSSS